MVKVWRFCRGKQAVPCSSYTKDTPRTFAPKVLRWLFILNHIHMDNSKKGFGSANYPAGVAQEARSKGGQESKGNFANDPERAAEAGRKGGQNNSGNFKNDSGKPEEERKDSQA